MTPSRSLTAALLTTLALTGCHFIPLNTESQEATVMPTPPTSMITPLVEKRETLVATGYAVVSVQNHKNPAQQRLLAIRASKLDAYRSLTEQVYGQQLDATTTVADIMTRNPYCVPPETKVTDAVLIMIERGFRHLPVVVAESQKILGVFSVRDALPREVTAAVSLAEFNEQVNDALG